MDFKEMISRVVELYELILAVDCAVQEVDFVFNCRNKNNFPFFLTTLLLFCRLKESKS
jgi:hypothetical protein